MAVWNRWMLEMHKITPFQAKRNRWTIEIWHCKRLGQQNRQKGKNDGMLSIYFMESNGMSSSACPTQYFPSLPLLCWSLVQSWHYLTVHCIWGVGGTVQLMTLPVVGDSMPSNTLCLDEHFEKLNDCFKCWSKLETLCQEDWMERIFNHCSKNSGKIRCQSPWQRFESRQCLKK